MKKLEKYKIALQAKYQQFILIKQSPPAWLLKIISPPWMCPHPGSWSLAVASPAWLLTQKSLPPDPRGGGEDTMKT